MLSLYLFGSPRLEFDGVPVHIPRRKATALLVYLAVSGQCHSRDALATLLWPENDHSGARAELRRTLSVLNRVLGEGWLQADRETVSWIPDPGKIFWLDLADFQDKLKVCESHNHPETVACLECTPVLEEAIILYQDDFMAGFSLKDCRAYDEWQFFQAEKLRRQLQEALVRLTAHYANTLEYKTAISYAQRWLALDPLQEAAHRQLMSLFAQSGQRNAALHQYQNCQEVLSSELGVEPSEETRELYQKIQASTLVTVAALRPKSNLPLQTTPFIGRENELAEIRAKLKDDDCRLLTLLGPGGSGKTRLAIEAAGGLLDDFKQGVFFANLAPLEEPARLPATIAASLSFSFFEEGTPEEQLLDYLGNKELLLVLDNFEHLSAGVNYISQILKDVPKVKILATSQVSLMVTDEHIYPVMGLAYPESPKTAEAVSRQHSAIRLFESGAKRRQPAFVLSDENIPDVVRICALLEGMPLGIVLASSWVELLTPGDIAAEIDRDLAFLETELQDLPLRQRGIRSVFKHSWRLLSEGERRIMCALSVFRGGFTREAAQEITNASLNDLMRLTHKSMLHRITDGRFEIHELLRQYAAEKLAIDSAVETDTRSKHSDHYCQALMIWERDLQGARQAEALKEIRLAIDNIYSSWVWAVDRKMVTSLLGAINGLCHFYERRNQHIEGERACRLVLEMLDSKGGTEQTEMRSLAIEKRSQIKVLKLQVRALSWRSHFNLHLVNTDLARRLVETSLNILEETRTSSQEIRFEKAMTLLRFSSAIDNESRFEAIQFAEDSLKNFKSLNKSWWIGKTLEALGELTLSRVERKKYFEESLTIRMKHGDQIGTADSLIMLSNELVHFLQFDEAEQLAREALSICRDSDDLHQILDAYGYLGSLMVWKGKFSEARLLVQENLVIYNDLGSPQKLANANAIAGYPDLYLGSYKEAHSQAQYGLALCRKVQHHLSVNGIVYSVDILGKIALAKRSYIEAQVYFQEILPLCQNFGWMENEGQVWASLGYVTRGMNHIGQSRSHIFNALGVAVTEQGFLALIHTLPGIALLFADQGDVERAVELYALASTQGIVANSKWFADIAGDEIARAAEGLPVELVEAAKARGKALDLWGTAKELLVELQEAGWGSEKQEIPAMEAS